MIKFDVFCDRVSLLFRIFVHALVQCSNWNYHAVHDRHFNHNRSKFSTVVLALVINKWYVFFHLVFALDPMIVDSVQVH